MFVNILEWSPAGRGVINCVIANAGISEVGSILAEDDPNSGNYLRSPLTPHPAVPSTFGLPF